MPRTLPDFTPSAANPPAPHQQFAWGASMITMTPEISVARVKYFAELRRNIIADCGEIVGDQP